MSYYCLSAKCGKLVQSRSLDHSENGVKINPPIITCKKSWSDFDLSQPIKKNNSVTLSRDSDCSDNLQKYVSIGSNIIICLFAVPLPMILKCWSEGRDKIF